MSRPPAPPSATKPGPISPAFVRALGRLRPMPPHTPLSVMSQSAAVVPIPTAAPASYEVRIRSGVGGTIIVVGHDRRGEVMVETRMHRRHVSAKTVKRMEQWCRDHDTAPDLRAV